MEPRKVHLQHADPETGNRLGQPVEAQQVSGMWTAVRQHDEGQVLRSLEGQPMGQGHVAWNVQTIPRRVVDEKRLRQRTILQLGIRGTQVVGAFVLTPVQVIARLHIARRCADNGGAAVRCGRHQPVAGIRQQLVQLCVKLFVPGVEVHAVNEFVLEVDRFQMRAVVCQLHTADRGTRVPHEQLAELGRYPHRIRTAHPAGTRVRRLRTAEPGCLWVAPARESPRPAPRAG